MTTKSRIFTIRRRPFRWVYDIAVIALAFAVDWRAGILVIAAGLDIERSTQEISGF